MSNSRSSVARKFEDLPHESGWIKPAGEVLAFKGRPKMTTRLVDVFDSAGGHVAAYTVCLEDEGCLDCEFEEVALVFAEQSGRVPEEDVAFLIARCHRD
ncbi:MAG TPA: hypothetical protein VGG10_18425 [Rhizomicrobium sp.]|jgi:hypothetical protein